MQNEDNIESTLINLNNLDSQNILTTEGKGKLLTASNNTKIITLQEDCNKQQDDDTVSTYYTITKKKRVASAENISDVELKHAENEIKSTEIRKSKRKEPNQKKIGHIVQRKIKQL